MKAIIFGITGQDGFYLKRLLDFQGYEVIGVSRTCNSWLIGDISDRSFVNNIINRYKPEFIFHFAANSTTQHTALFENNATICTGTLNILEAVKEFCPLCKVFISGSAVQFKNEGLPIDEKTQFAPLSPYAVSRISSVYMARYYRLKFGLQIYVGYFFNHDSPLRTERHVNQKIVKSVLRIANGNDERLTIGSVDVLKEFNFASDIIDAVWILVNQNDISEAVIGCGNAHSIKDWINACFKYKQLNWVDYVDIEDDYAPEYHILVSNPQLIKSLGWRSKHNFQDQVKIMMEAK